MHQVLRRIINGTSSAGRKAQLAPLALLAILAAVVLLYAPTLHDAFHGDDFVAFTEFKRMDFWQYSKAVFLFKDNNFYWRPLGSIFHYVLYAGFGLNPFVFRVAELLFFLATLVCLYLFCLGERLGRLTALGTVLVFGFFPSHVVSVTWVTNTSRVTSGLMVVVCLLLLQRSRDSRSAWLWEAAGFLAFTIACLNDETTTALAPLPFVYATLVVHRHIEWRSAFVRAIFYGALVCVIVPLQFTYTINDEARLTQYGFGPHIFTSLWVLASQMSLPLAAGSPVGVTIQLVRPAQWAAGLVTLTLCCGLFLAGSRQLKFLVVWLGLALAPFALWEPEYISPRYVYLAAMPFAILVSWCFVRLVPWLIALLAQVPRLPRYVAPAVVSSAAVAVFASAALFSVRATSDRNAAWSHETAKYGMLRAALEKEFPTLPPGTRLIVLYGEWPDFWASSVARALYGDFSLWVTSIPPDRVDQAEIKTNPNDVLVYLLHDRLMAVNSRH